MTMTILVFKTNIKSRRNIKSVRPVFRDYPAITDWSVDTEDVDNVLRVEALDSLKEKDVIRLVKKCGFQCEALAD